MAAAPVTEGAITASLLFAIGYGRTPSSPASDLSPELREPVTKTLQDQGCDLGPALDAVQAGLEALKQDPSLSISAQRYDQLRSEFLRAQGIEPGKGRNLWPVGGTTILKRAGGSWSEGLRRAGLGVTAKSTATGFGSSRFTPEQFTAAIQDFLEDATRQGLTLSYQSYLAWRKLSQERGRTDLPSGPSIRNTYGSWSAALNAPGEV